MLRCSHSLDDIKVEMLKEEEEDRACKCKQMFVCICMNYNFKT
jgi:hypothetical protein